MIEGRSAFHNPIYEIEGLNVHSDMSKLILDLFFFSPSHDHCSTKLTVSYIHVQDTRKEHTDLTLSNCDFIAINLLIFLISVIAKSFPQRTSSKGDDQHLLVIVIRRKRIYLNDFPSFTNANKVCYEFSFDH